MDNPFVKRARQGNKRAHVEKSSQVNVGKTVHVGNEYPAVREGGRVVWVRLA